MYLLKNIQIINLPISSYMTIWRDHYYLFLHFNIKLNTRLKFHCNFIIKDTFQKYIDCLRVGGNRFVDSILGFQTGNKDDIEKTDSIEKAYNMAKEIKINE